MLTRDRRHLLAFHELRKRHLPQTVLTRDRRHLLAFHEFRVYTRGNVDDVVIRFVVRVSAKIPKLASQMLESIGINRLALARADQRVDKPTRLALEGRVRTARSRSNVSALGGR